MQNNKNVENKTDQQTTGLKNKKSKFAKGLIMAMEVMVLIITFIVVILIYLHNSRFKVAFNQMQLDDYFNGGEISQIINVKHNTVSIELPSDVITTSFNDKMKELQLPKGYKILDGYIDTKESKAYINLNIYGINIPVAMDIVLEIDNREVTIKFNHMTLRNKKLFSLPKSVEKSLISKLINNDSLLKISLDDYKIPTITSINNITLQQDKIVVLLTIDEDKVKELMKKISHIKSEELYGIYKNDTDDYKQKAVELIDESATITKAHIESILSDLLLSDEALIKNLLTITDESNIDYIFNNYGKYINHFNKKHIMNDKNKLILGKIEKYCTTLLDLVGQLPKEDYIIYLNNPYSLESDSSLTLGDMVTTYELSIPEDIYNKMKFLYNYDTKNYMISYKIDDTEYAIVDNENYNFINNSDYKKYEFDEPLEPGLVYDEEIKSKIEDYFSSYVFIRYMKSDGKYAYVIASDENNYQDYEKFALEKQESWEIIDTNINDLYVFSSNHPGFNIKTLTDDYLDDTLYALSEADKFALMDQLEYRDIIPDKKTVGLKYCSYDGNYIALKLTNDEEYVFQIKYSYLDKLYKKDIAVKKWKDISPLILLQEDNTESSDN